MTVCRQCGSPDVECTESGGELMRGRFWEDYRCQNCGATGTIRGDAGKLLEADKVGEVFNA